MNPSALFCPNPDCPKHALVGQGNITSHSRQERRFRCSACQKTFVDTRGTPFYRLQTDPELVTLVVTLLAFGCPRPAIVHAFGFDERTVQNWAERAGAHCQQVHAKLVEAGQVAAPQVQADELWVKLVGRKVWRALALAAPSSRWQNGLSTHCWRGTTSKSHIKR